MEQGQQSIKINVDREAAQILSAATAAVRAILDRRSALDADGQYDTPLAVILGESHDNPAHLAAQMIILDQLSAWHKGEATEKPGTSPVILCHELEHNSLAQLYGHLTQTEATPEVRARLVADDPQGKIAAKTYLGCFALYRCDFSKAALIRSAIAHHVLNFMTDCEKDGATLSTTDPTTRAAITACGLGSATPDLISPEGVWARNDHMAKKALAHATENGARIILQQCGNAHVVGLEDHRTGRAVYETEKSLAATFKKAGAAVIAMPQTGAPTEKHDVLKNHRLGLKEYFALANFPRHVSDYNPFTNDPYPEETPQDNDSFVRFVKRDQEAGYLNALLERTGLAHAALPLNDYYQKRMEDFAELHRYCTAIAHTQPHPAVA